MPSTTSTFASDLRAATPRLTTTVPREYVHRAALSEVFLTGWKADSSDSFLVSAQWPRGHASFVPAHGHQDPLLLVESVRQVGSLLAHAEYGVPLGHQFLMWDMSFTTDAELLEVGPTPSEPLLRVTCEPTYRGKSFTGMRYRTLVELGSGVRLAMAEASFSCTSPAVYKRLRGDRPLTSSLLNAVPLAPETVGRANARDVVLAATQAATPRLYQLRVDTEHPNFFDHPVDHVPGMVLVEAARQAAHAAAGQPNALVVGMESAFTQYVELDAQCFIEAEVERDRPLGRIAVSARGIQRGETVFTTSVTLCPRQYL